MPLRVHCPNNCLIRMPNNRAGRIVRCPQCKSPIKIPEVSESELASGKPIPCYARIAVPRNPERLESADESLAQDADSQSTSLRGLESVRQPMSESKAEPTGEAVSETQDSESESSKHNPPLVVPDVLKPTEKTSVAMASLSDGTKTHHLNGEQNATDDARVSESLDPKLIQDGVSEPDTNPKNSESQTLVDQASAPIIDQRAHSESPEDRVDGEDVPVLVKEAGKTAAKKMADESEVQKSNRQEVSRLVDDVPGPMSAQSNLAAADKSVVVDSDLDAADSKGLPSSQLASLTIPKPKQRLLNSDELPKPRAGNSNLRKSQTEKNPEPVGQAEAEAEPSPYLIDLTTGDLAEIQNDRDWRDRLEKANSDRRTLARFFALCLCFVSLVNMIPAIYHWYQWTEMADSMALPRWIYILIFVGAVHLIYAVFLVQITDWSAMRAVSIAMLALAFVFGFVSTGLLFGGGQGNLASFLGIPFTLNQQACIWCVAMLCLATLMSYWAGKESSNWQRANQLLQEILASSSGRA